MRWTGQELLRTLRAQGCQVIRQKGSHVRVKCGACSTTVPVHAGQTLPPGTVGQIKRDLSACLRKGWLE